MNKVTMAIELAKQEWNDQTSYNTTVSPLAGADLNWFAMLLIPIPVWIFFGNLTVLVVIAENLTLRRTWSNKIIFSLALTDMTISVVVMPFAAIGQLCNGYWPFGFGVCAFHILSDVYFCSSSIMHLLLIAVNRYAAIGWPLSYRRVNMAAGLQALLLSGVWCMPILIVAPLCIHVIFNPEGIYKEGHCDIFYNGFILYGSILVFYFPLLVMITVDIRSFFLLKKKSRTSERLKSVIIHVGIERMVSHDQSQSSRKNSIMVQLDRLRKLFLKRRATTDGTSNGGIVPQKEAQNKTSRVQNGLCVTPSRAVITKRSSLGNLGESGNLKRNTTNLLIHAASEKNSPTISPSKTFTLGNPEGEESMTSLTKMRQSLSAFSLIDPVKRFFQKQRAETALLTVFIVFVICWMPFFTTNVLQTFFDSIKQQDTLFLAFVWLGYCSSGLNPIIYPVFNSEYRKCFVKTFGKTKSTQDRQNSSIGGLRAIRESRRSTTASDSGVVSSTLPSANPQQIIANSSSKNATEIQHELDSYVSSPTATSPSAINVHVQTEFFPRITSQSMIALSSYCMPTTENEDLIEIPDNEKLEALIVDEKRLMPIDGETNEENIVYNV